MAWFSKPKKAERVAPALCFRCREQLGTALLRFVAGPGAPPVQGTHRLAWLCDACQNAVRREATDN